ncbi:short-chain dehydrogenase/ reductase-like protein [Mytilinidion resinicola]|uniref:Short-chain dehydrogenase/ reductase-like protein n=1 Tax=Mytilinidion resinicola TaxID=574789 RepID=A0A6A6YVN0_9PEZI|nr:short-chain dehydrogenase/ reductase-like protein [Mytilinidion resinicola]KAF2812579.1 short-chain dehydrogenase/ reductase-like protein [Mytilinidion resinicola]
MSFHYNKILIIGATSGIGEAYAEKLIQDGKQVIIVGRRKDRLDAFVSKHGQERVEAIQFDIKLLNQIPKFALDVTNAHPDLDCVLLNAGIQRAFNFLKPETVDLSILDEETLTNYTAFIHLTLAFIPHLQKQPGDTSLIYTSSSLALIPVVQCLNYSASKAALHHFLLCLREQLADGPERIKVIEIFPPAVQTELHDDIKNGRAIGMPLVDFVKDSWAKLVHGDDQIAVGMVEAVFNGFEKLRSGMFFKGVQRPT